MLPGGMGSVTSGNQTKLKTPVPWVSLTGLHMACTHSESTQGGQGKGSGTGIATRAINGSLRKFHKVDLEGSERE